MMTHQFVNVAVTQTSGGLWRPTDLGAALKGWYDADQQTESNGSEVPTLIDRSGNGNDFVEGGLLAPTLQHNFVNGKKALECAGRRMERSSTLLSGATACAAFWLVKGVADPSSSPNDRAPLNVFGNTGADASHYYTDGIWYETFGTTSRRSVNPPTSWANWHIGGVTSASNDYKMWWNGTDLGVTASPNTVDTGSATRKMFDLFDGHAAQVILMNAVPSTSDRQKIEGYLAHHAGIQASLPGGHPYASSPP